MKWLLTICLVRVCLAQSPDTQVPLVERPLEERVREGKKDVRRYMLLGAGVCILYLTFRRLKNKNKL